MMDIIFSSDGADELNHLVQKKISPDLFLCCNYNPTSCNGLNDDGKFFPAVLNLYKFAFDSSCIIRRLTSFQPRIYVRNNNHDKLRKALDTISILRAFIAHNNSDFNGRVEASTIEQYHQWVQLQTGKPDPDCPADYTKMLDALKSLAAELFAALEEYIDAVSMHRDKKKLIEAWRDEIIIWYSKNDGVKRNIFIGELENAFLAKAQTFHVENLKLKVALWVQEYYTKESALKQLRSLGSRNSQVMKAIADREREIEKIKAETRRYYYGQEPYNFLDRLFYELPDMLYDTLDKERCSMLPDDLLQRQIQLLFNNIPIPS